MKKYFGCLCGITMCILLAWTGAMAGEITVYTALDTDDVKVYVDAFQKEVHPRKL